MAWDDTKTDGVSSLPASEWNTHVTDQKDRFSKTNDDSDDIIEGSSNKFLAATDKTKLDGIEAGAEANNISDINATDLTDSGDSTLHYHASDRNRSNHTGTQTASTISDFDTEVANNSAVAANTSKVSNATHSGEVTGATTLTIADNVVDEANLKVSNSPTNDYVLTADDGVSGGLKWASAGGVGTVTSVAAGDGMDFTTITASGTVTLGTPGTLNADTVSTVTSTSHTHTITCGISDNNIVQIDSASVADNEYARFTANGLESRSTTEVKSDLALAASDISDFDTEVSNNTDVSANTGARHTQNTDTALGSGAVAADHGTATTDQIINVCYGTSATPPTASTTTEGALYIQYTA